MPDYGVGPPDGGEGSDLGGSFTTNAVPNTEDSNDFGRKVLHWIIKNDGTSDIEYGFGVSTATRSFTVKPGETLSIDLVFQTLYYKSSGTSIPFRVLPI